MKNKRSTALELIMFVWNNSPMHGRSWDRLNHAMSDAVHLAINAGLEFALDDFSTLASKCRMGRWSFHDTVHLGENFYRFAVKMNHMGACQSLEKMMDRKPFIFQKHRVCVGTQFDVLDVCNGKLKDFGLHVTSFSPDHSVINVCSYLAKDGTWQQNPTRKLKINHKQLKQYEQLMAKFKKAKEQCHKMGDEEVAEEEKKLIAELKAIGKAK